MTKFSLIGFLTLGAASIGCHDNAAHQHSPDGAVPPAKKALAADHADHAAHAEHADSVEGKLTLNDGKKWQSDEHTRKTMASIAALVAMPSPADATAFNKRGAELAALNGSLIKGCTMQGASHENLHVLLVPLLKETDALKSATTVDAGNTALKNLRETATLYAKYFD